MRTRTDALNNVGGEDGPAPGGIPRARLAALCQPERIERTLYLLCSLNLWAKARERLLYADRQGLYRVKAALVRQAFVAGLLSPVSYIDGSAGGMKIAVGSGGTDIIIGSIAPAKVGTISSDVLVASRSRVPITR